MGVSRGTPSLCQCSCCKACRETTKIPSRHAPPGTHAGFCAMTSVAMGTSHASAIGLSSLTSLHLRGDEADDTAIDATHRVKPRKLGALWSVSGCVFYCNRR